MTVRRLFPLIAACWALLLGACSSFERDWKSARSASAAKAQKRADPFAGAWDGKWVSEKHRLPTGPAGGRLRCLFSKVDDQHYHARFYANWLVFATGYEVTFETQRRGKVLAFRGSHDLGAIFGGIYKYEGQVTAGQFQSAFSCKYDYGRFDMTRPTP